jgi:hypothetical protein
MDLDPDSVIPSITGRTIVGGEIDVEARGFHLKLDDGRCVIFTGMFVVAVVEIGKTLQ